MICENSETSKLGYQIMIKLGSVFASIVISSIVIGSILVSATLPAQASGPVGAEFQVNAYTTGRQSNPAVASHPNGDFVVLWESYGGEGGAGLLSIQGRKYHSDGSPQAGQFTVGSSSPQYDPAVATSPTGGFVAVWEFWQGGNALLGIQAQQFNADGTALGAAFQVDSSTLYYQLSPEVAVGPDGSFMIVWQSDQSGDSDSSLLSVQAQVFSQAGRPVGSELQVNTYTTGRQDSPVVTSAANGEFMVVWSSEGAVDDPSRSIQGRRFSSIGQPLSQAIQINQVVGGQQDSPSIAAGPNDQVVVVWRNEPAIPRRGPASSIQGRRLSFDGSPIGNEFRIDETLGTSPTAPQVAVQNDGTFLVVWQSESSAEGDTQGLSVQARRLNSAGAAIGSQFQINTSTVGDQSVPRIATAPYGRTLAVWQSQSSAGTDTSEESIQGQRFQFPIFEDGFESGDISNWLRILPDP